MTTLTTDRLGRLRELARTLLDDLHLAGRWRWSGNIGGGWVHLATMNGGRRTVTGVTQLHEHYELNAAEDDYERVATDCTDADCGRGVYRPMPTFPTPSGDAWPLLRRADEIPVFAVCPEATSADDPRVYRTDVIGFRSPAAEWLAELDAETVLELVDTAAVLWAELVTQEHDSLRWENPRAVPQWTQRLREQLGRPWEPDCRACAAGPGRAYRDQATFPRLFGWDPPVRRMLEVDSGYEVDALVLSQATEKFAWEWIPGKAIVGPRPDSSTGPFPIIGFTLYSGLSGRTKVEYGDLLVRGRGDDWQQVPAGLADRYAPLGTREVQPS